MSAPGPNDWYGRLATTMVDVADRVGALATLIGDDWRDDRGRDRVERLVTLQRSLHREAEAAHRLATAPDHRDEQGQGPLLVLPGRTASPGSGVRLPGTEAEHTDDEPGVRLPGN